MDLDLGIEMGLIYNANLNVMFDSLVYSLDIVSYFFSWKMLRGKHFHRVLIRFMFIIHSVLDKSVYVRNYV